ncbi:MAG: hypothetical protein AAB895_03775, partial [Patescibacteria group bacterium]
YDNWKYLAIGALASIVLFMATFRIYKRASISQNIKDLEKEESEISKLLAQNQRRYFSGKISPEAYAGMSEQYENRVAEIKKEMAHLRSKRIKLLKTKSEMKELNSEARRVENDIKKIQEAYYAKRKMKESDYNTQFKMLNERLAEI